MREGLVQNLLFFVLVLALPLILASMPRIFDDGDVSWHIAAGQWILQHRAIPMTDPFSFTAASRPWVAMEWLADLVFAWGYKLAGYAGLATIVAAALIALHAILFVYLQRRTSPVAIVAALLLMDIVLAPFMLARPHVLVWPLLAAWTALFARATESGRPPPLWAALLLVVWTNLHGSYPLAALIGAPLAFDALVKAKWATFKPWLLFTGVCAVAVCLNANGLAGLLQPFRVANLEMLPLIQEWQPSTPAATPIFFPVLLLTLGLMLWRGVRIPLGRLVLLLAMLFLAFSQERHQSWFTIVAALLVTPLFETRAEPARSPGWLGLAALPLLALRAALPITPTENAANPRQLIAHVPAALRGQPVLNGYTFGGPLILAGIKPYIDGRAEIYGDSFVSDYWAITQGDATKLDRTVQHYRIRWTMVPASQQRLLALLDGSSKWRRIYSDKVGVIHVRVD